MTRNHFDAEAATWDSEPRRVALMKSIGEAVVREVRPTRSMRVLDYGCGTGLVSLYLLPHVGEVVGADNSEGMLEVLRGKITSSGLSNLRAMRLNLEEDEPPAERFDMVLTSMTLHHVGAIGRVLGAFYALLAPGGVVCIADLDTEPGTFHRRPETVESVRHHGFERAGLKRQLAAAGFVSARDVTATTIVKTVASGEEESFPVFLIWAWKA